MSGSSPLSYEDAEWRSDHVFMTISHIAKSYMTYKLRPSPKSFNEWERCQMNIIKSLELDYFHEPKHVRGLLAIEILEEAMKSLDNSIA